MGARLLLQSYQYPNLSEGADRVGGQLRGDKECPFSGVTKSGRVWRKVPESDARSETSSKTCLTPNCLQRRAGGVRESPGGLGGWRLPYAAPLSPPEWGAEIAQWLSAGLMIERTRVRVLAGTAGECSSPRSTFCADLSFGIRSTPVLPQVARTRSRSFCQK